MRVLAENAKSCFFRILEIVKWEWNSNILLCHFNCTLSLWMFCVNEVEKICNSKFALLKEDYKSSKNLLAKDMGQSGEMYSFFYISELKVLLPMVKSSLIEYFFYCFILHCKKFHFRQMLSEVSLLLLSSISDKVWLFSEPQTIGTALTF